MQVVFVNGTLSDLKAINTSNSLVIMTSPHIQELDMVEELQGVTNTFKELAQFSISNKVTVCYLFEAKVYKKRYLSALVIDNGKILGVSDMTHRLSPELYLDRGQCYRLYESERGKFGVILGDDIFFPEVARIERLSGAEFYLFLSPLKYDNPTRLAVKANSLCNGINTMYATADECGIIGLYGNIIMKSTDFCSEFEIAIEHDDRLILARRSGIYNDIYINDN